MPTTGSPSDVAVAKPVARFEQPGAEVTNATPDFPVIRPMPLAMNAAFCSCRQTMVLIFESSSTSKTLSIFAPGMPKMYSTPCASRLLTSNSAPVCGADFNVCGDSNVSTRVVISSVLLLALDPRPDRGVGQLLGNPRFPAARCGNYLRAEFQCADLRRCIAADGLHNCGRLIRNAGDSPAHSATEHTRGTKSPPVFRKSR